MEWIDEKSRCRWANPKNERYIRYHDEEWAFRCYTRDLKKMGMKFVGTTDIYAYLQVVGVIYSHEQGCFLAH